MYSNFLRDMLPFTEKKEIEAVGDKGVPEYRDITSISFKCIEIRYATFKCVH